MGLKKYEIITVGSDKRVRALRSWPVGDRYVNIGDTGGIVYDEKTLSQDGACWLFRGNFGFPGARIGGDSIVDVGETTLSATGTPAVDILGASVVVGSALRFGVINGVADATILSPINFEAGSLNYATGSNWETWKQPSPNYLRTKAPIFNGGVSTTVLKLEVPGYTVQAYVLDRDGKGVTSTASTNTGAGVTLAIPAGQYFLVQLSKNPVTSIALSDVTTAAITYTTLYDGKLVINDSRLEINPATGTGVLTLRPGGTYPVVVGSKYPDSVIQNSKISIGGHATDNRTITLMAEFIDTSAFIDVSVELAPAIIGLYRGVKNLAFSGSVTRSSGISIRGAIQATNCDNFAVSPTIFPGLAAAVSASQPFIFQGCNVPGGRFFHHAQIANTYKNIDFAKAQADLGKLTANGITMASAEVEGMYRLTNGTFMAALVESHDSVKSLDISGTTNTYSTTIYKDAYFKGMFDFAGTNVFGGSVGSHPLAQVLNVSQRVVQGNINSTSVGQTVTGVVPSANHLFIPHPFRINGAVGFSVEGLPMGVEATGVFVTPSKVITSSASSSGRVFTAPYSWIGGFGVFLRFRKTNNSPIVPADLAGATVTVYKGCKIVNTGAKAVNLKGNIRVEDNATLVNASITGSGYFGGNSVVYYNPAVWASLDFNGTVFMKDDTVFAPSALTGASALVRMEGNAKFTGSVDVASTNLSFIMRDNAVIEGKANTRSGVVMSGNSKVTATGQIMAASRGVLIMEENASIEANTTIIGAITLAGNYKGNVTKTWTGKRTITDVNEPEYSNNVKTQYDF